MECEEAKVEIQVEVAVSEGGQMAKQVVSVEAVSLVVEVPAVEVSVVAEMAVGALEVAGWAVVEKVVEGLEEGEKAMVVMVAASEVEEELVAVVRAGAVLEVAVWVVVAPVVVEMVVVAVVAVELGAGALVVVMVASQVAAEVEEVEQLEVVAKGMENVAAHSEDPHSLQWEVQCDKRCPAKPHRRV